MRRGQGSSSDVLSRTRSVPDTVQAPAARGLAQKTGVSNKSPSIRPQKTCQISKISGHQNRLSAQLPEGHDKL